MDIARRSGESDLDFQRRIVYGKLVDKTLSDYDYSELAELIYGQTYSSDFARRLMYGSLRTLEAVDKCGATPDESHRDMCKYLDDKIVEFKKEKQKFSDQRREFNRLVSDEARLEHLHSKVVEAANRLQPLGKMFEPHLDAAPLNGENEAIIVFSDWHFGMVTHNVFNEYNTEICKQRVNNVVNRAITRIILNGCRKLHVVVLGDLIHGNCHVSARVASEEVAVEQLMHASELLAQAIASLSAYVGETYVYSTYGNHARAVANKKDSIHRDNLERCIEWWLTERFSSVHNVTVVKGDTEEFLFIDACGHGICASHGDLDSVRTSPRLLPALFNKKYGKNVEHILIGDKHHHESFEELGVTATICGSLCGTDDYANDKRLYSTPSQLLLTVTPEDGVDAEYRLHCDN